MMVNPVISKQTTLKTQKVVEDDVNKRRRVYTKVKQLMLVLMMKMNIILVLMK